MCDSDRLSADDTLGIIDVSVPELVEKSINTPGEELFQRTDPLSSERPGMRSQGEVVWSVRFFPLWRLPDEELQKRVAELRDRRGEGHTVPPWWLKWLEDLMDKPDWEYEREQRRQETREYFTGERARDEIEASVKPPVDRNSGVLQFHIHQCTDLEMESLAGTFSGAAFSRRKSAASGKPALDDVIDREPTENPEPPSTYCEVHLNDKYVYRTRTKQVNPMPYFNAMSERFVRDWQLAKISFVIKDERDLEHGESDVDTGSTVLTIDPILGVVSLRLRDVFSDRTQFTRWFPLIGGLGWGRLRISLLFKPLDMKLPRGISTFEACTFDLQSFTTVDLAPLLGGKHPGIVIETEYDRAILHPPFIDKASDRSSIDKASHGSSPEKHSHRTSLESHIHIPHSVSLDSLKRHSNRNSTDSQHQSSSNRNSTDSQRATPSSNNDSNTNLLLPTYQFDAAGHQAVDWELPKPLRLAVKYRHSCSVLFSVATRHRLTPSKVHALAVLRLDDVPDGEETSRMIPVFDTSSVKDAMKASSAFAASQAQPAAPPPGLPTGVRLVGFIRLKFILHPGVSRAHKKLCKRDRKFRSVYMAWEATRLQDNPAAIEAEAKEVKEAKEHHEDEYELDSEHESIDVEESDDTGAAAAAAMHEDDTRAMNEGHGAHAKALHSKVRVGLISC